MSEPKLISPMLDNFAMGKPISDHHGVRCCPAMEQDSDNKYIVKVISIPANPRQLEAMLLSGAFSSKEAAMVYFKELADGAADEAEILKKLAKLEGFVPYERWQVEPAEDGNGYDVYLLGSYKRSLERHFRRETMTHLNAVNLGLDLCAAMAVCRRMGYLYVDLKPGNIFISDDNEYRVGDLGFVKLDSLQYAALPNRYRSSYTAPEFSDALSTLNTTMDTYAIGLILYQVYNGGKLPFEGSAPAAALEAPAYADYEMAEIILKACDPDPGKRWEDPIQMGQALVAYMQRNSVDDTPIVPPAAPVFVTPEAAAEADAEEAAEPIPADETLPDEASPEELTDAALTDEVSEMLAQADELLSHETPEPVVAPEPVDMDALAAEAQATTEEAEDETQDEEENPIDLDLINAISQADESQKAQEESTVQPDNDIQQEIEGSKPKTSHRRHRPKKALIIGIIAVVLAAAVLFGAHFYYTNVYLQTVDKLTLNGQENQLTVTLDTKIDNSLLTVVCTNTYGNAQRCKVSNGTAIFTDLTPGDLYTVKVEIEGFHKLQGQTSTSYTTPSQTKIISFSAVTGAEDGSVVLSFTVDGPESDTWTVRYTAEGEDEKEISFTGHMITVSGLTVDKLYTFQLICDTDSYIVGTDTLEYTARKPVYAENLTITKCMDETLAVQWSVPENAAVESWSVRCYNENGFDETIQVTEPMAEFTGVDCSAAYTVEVIAEGMTLGSRTYISANSRTIYDLAHDASNPTKLVLTWHHTGSVPAEGWLLMYTLAGTENQEVVRCDSSTGTIPAIIPGETYEIVIQAADGATVFGGTYSYTAPEAQAFSNYGATTASMTFLMCKAPDRAGWTRRDIADSAYTTTFAVGEKAGFVIRVKAYSLSSDQITPLFVIRDANGDLVSADTGITTTWTAMWDQYGYSALNVPAMPTAPGSYTMDIYFNGSTAGTVSFTIQ
ncbi:MAG: protein kinase [Oscillospiraceae bacterium]|nr:protein kinase [Oscillospiraceae bacterium]